MKSDFLDLIPELVKLSPWKRNGEGDTPFHVAARTGHPYCFEAMLQVAQRHSIIY